MSRLARAGVMILVGATALHLIRTGTFAWFLQQRMRWPLLLAGIIAAALGLYQFVKPEDQSTDDHTHEPHVDVEGSDEQEMPGHHHHHSGSPRIGWLLLIPTLILIAVAPAALGATAATRGDTLRPLEPNGAYPPLSDGVTPMKIYDFTQRAVWDRSYGLDGHQIELTGIVVHDSDFPDGFLLTRFVVNCCAADGLPVQVGVRYDGDDFDNDTWVTAIVQLAPPDQPYLELPEPWFVEVEPESIEILDDPPDSLYESL